MTPGGYAETISVLCVLVVQRREVGPHASETVFSGEMLLCGWNGRWGVISYQQTDVYPAPCADTIIVPSLIKNPCPLNLPLDNIRVFQSCSPCADYCCGTNGCLWH